MAKTSVNVRDRKRRKLVAKYSAKRKELKANGLLATCVQHEVDHLNGILFIDYLSKLKKDMIIKKLVKQKKGIERVIV